jgi:hypothetical protein
MSKQEIVLSDNLGDDLSRLLANRSLDDIFILCDEKTKNALNNSINVEDYKKYECRESYSVNTTSLLFVRTKELDIFAS